jgi:hypothetical protein
MVRWSTLSKKTFLRYKAEHKTMQAKIIESLVSRSTWAMRGESPTGAKCGNQRKNETKIDAFFEKNEHTRRCSRYIC